MTNKSIPENDIIIIEEEEAAAAAPYPPPADRRRRKKSGAFGIFKAALYMVRRRHVSAKEEAGERRDPNPNPNPNWTKLVGSVRPFHLQEGAESPPRAEGVVPPGSPASSSSRGTMSQYSSAASLLDLDNSSDDEEEEDPDEVFDALTGDEMIDAKADEFIAQFYKQMQLQKTNTYHHHHQLSRGI